MRLEQAYFFEPENPVGQFLTDKTIWTLLRQDPRLEYKVENEQVYVISDGADCSLVVPKDRNIPEIYSPRNQRPLDKAFVMLGWAFLGLALAGIGTLIFVPLAIVQALRMLFTGRPVNRVDRIRIVIVMINAAILLILALSLIYLFYLHF
jgi:hypothetical protein